MVADEERVIGSDRVTEVFDRRLIVGWAITQLDERLLTRQRIEHGAGADTVGQPRRQFWLGRCRDRSQRQAARDRRTGRSRAAEKVPSIERRHHASSPAAPSSQTILHNARSVEMYF